MRKIILILSFILFPFIISAQTITKTLEWDYLNTPLVDVNGYTTSLKIDAAVAAIIIPSCVTSGPNVHCTSPMTLTNGAHTLTVTAINAAGTNSGFFNYNPGSPPSIPSGVKVTIVVTIP